MGVYDDFITEATDAKAEAKAERIRANVNQQSSSLAELAMLREVETTEAQRAQAARDRAENDQARQAYLDAMYGRDVARVRELIAEAWDLPADHEYIAGLALTLDSKGWSDAKYEWGGDGRVRVVAPVGTVLPEEVFETRIEGYRVRVTVERSAREPEITAVTLRAFGVNGPVVVDTLTALGKFLRTAATAGA